jgi:hypothetical protein
MTLAVAPEAIPWQRGIMRDFEDSTLWRISAFDRIRHETGASGFTRLSGPTLLSSTLTSDLNRLDRTPDGGDLLETMAACLRHREAALLYVQHEALVWPLTLFPAQMLYHAPRDFTQASTRGLAVASLLGIEPPGVRPPGHWMYERVAQAEHYRPLMPLLWNMALHGPRNSLLREIGGIAAYRALRVPHGLPAPGALGPATERLREQPASLRTMARWPGMNVERASRLLNALYLASCLMVTRTHPAARAEPGVVRRLLGRGRHRQ